jgi:outer membrane protein OmpA-like peptidoglycan-associated protein
MTELLSKSRTVVVLLMTAALAAGASGCFTGEAAEPSATDACGEPGEGAGPKVAVLVQRGLDGLGDEATGRAAVDTAVAAATEMEARVLVGEVTGRGSAPLLADAELVETGANDLEREGALECRTKAVQGAYRSAAAAKPAEGVDLIAALRGLHSALPGGPGETVDLLIVGSALNSSSPDLGDPAQRGGPAKSINQLAKEGINFRCDGWRVHMVGGSVAQGEPLPAAVDSELREWWRRYFQHCGGTLVYYAPQLTGFPVTEEVAVADRSLIPIEVEEKQDRVEATLSGDVLFAFESADLDPAAGSVLRRLLPVLESTEGAVAVEGYTDSTGTEAVNLPLSRRRAQAVAGWILAHASLDGRRLRVSGYGAANPMASNATAAGRAKNRRVVVVVQR